MTATHILILVAFVFFGGMGMAAIQESLSLCLRSVFKHRASVSQTRQRSDRPRCTSLAIR